MDAPRPGITDLEAIRRLFHAWKTTPLAERAALEAQIRVLADRVWPKARRVEPEP